MYEVLKIHKSDTTFFTFKNLETGKEIKCFEPFEYEEELKVFHFIKEGGIYNVLIGILGDVIDEKEKEWDNYYEILELNVKIGWFKFAKLRLNDEIFYIEMASIRDVKDIENKKSILLRRHYYSVLKVEEVVNDKYELPNVKVEDLPILREEAEKNGDNINASYYAFLISEIEKDK